MVWLINSEKNDSKQFKILSKKLEKKRSAFLEEFKAKNKEVLDWARKKGIKAEDLVTKSARSLAAGAATSAVVLTSGFRPQSELPKPEVVSKELKDETFSASLKAKQDVTKSVKKVLRSTNLSDEKEVAKVLSKVLKMQIKPELDGIRLNTTWGIMGYESHLTRYPGDNLATHFQSQGDYQRFSHAAMAGGPGAWGHIAPSKQVLTQKDVERERYYLVAQTFLSPNWGSPQVKQWFRHRKMVVVNPQTGRVVIGVLEDAGPEPSTGRKFGGSPEIMEELRFGGGGSYVLMFFVDDPKDKIPLGAYGL